MTLRALDMTNDDGYESSLDNITAWLSSASGYVVYRLRMSDSAGESDAVVDLVSPSLTDVMGVEPNAPFDQWFRRIHPDDRERVEAASGTAAMAVERFEAVMRIWHPRAEEWRWVHAVSNPVLENDRLFFNGLIIDVTAERRALEREADLRDRLEAAERLETVGRLAAGVAHDFNNLLMVIGASADQIGHDTSRNYIEQLTTQIQRQVAAGADLTDQLLGYAHKGTYSPALIDLVPPLTNVVGTVTRTRKDVRFRCEVPATAWAHADATQIERVVMNLLINSLEAMPRGGAINVSLTRSGAMHELVVADDGVGIAASTKRRVFEPFYSTKTGGGGRRGVGLGLSATRGIMESLGGTIGLDSQPGEGTIVTARIPARPAPPDAAESPEINGGSDHEPQPVVDTALSVLLLDDEAPVRDVVAALLNALGHASRSASSGDEALTILQTGPPIDLILMDLVMPGVSGSQLMGEMRRLAPAAAILVCSGYPDELVVREIMDMGAAGFLKKPFGLEELRAAITAVAR